MSVPAARGAGHYDALETRDPAERERALMAALPSQIEYARSRSTAFARILAGIDPRQVDSRAALARLPVTRKSDLAAMQRAAPPFGGLTATAPGRLARIFVSPGPIHDPEGTGADYWRTARALYASGVRAGDVIQNCFSYHFTPAGSMVECGARAIGCAVIPAGVGQTDTQVEAIASLRPGAYCGTPSFLRIIVERALETGADVSSLRHASVSAEALPPSLRAWLKAHGIASVMQWYGTADLGCIAYESEALEGLIVNEDLIVELLRPGSGEPVADGEVGEVVVTAFNPDYPLVRFATGDLSAILSGASPCGRTNLRIRGWMGRADQTTKVKGLFVHPSQVAEVLGRHAEIVRARLVIDNPDGQDRMTLHCEIDGATEGREALAAAIGASLYEITRLHGQVALKARGELPSDGKLIEDAKRYD